jgi:hypothetical protein
MQDGCEPRPDGPLDGAASDKALSPQARRALTEAAERRRAADARAAGAVPKEHQGRGGLDPTRYEDWEVKGIASDF